MEYSTLHPRVAALGALLALCACPMDNPGFLDTEGAGGSTTAAATGTDGATTTTTTAAAGSGSESASSSSSAGSTADATSSGGDMTTAVSAPDTSTGDPGTTTETTTGDPTTGGCVMAELAIGAAADAFFISGGTDGGTTCTYYDQVPGAQHACKKLNFGKVGGLRIARMDGGIDAMYAVRFQHEPLVELVNQGVEIVEAQLELTLYAQIFDEGQLLRVGKIGEEWLEGNKPGDLAVDGDSSFAHRSIGNAAVWSGGDGPRGASVEVASVAIPADYAEHEVVLSTPFDVTDWALDPLANNGLVISYQQGVAPDLFGPGIKTRESGVYAPRLIVRYCKF